ncbi:embryonic polyadenylate-binding protein 2 isoform X1 [Anas acuta]|uniref:embryonic polyadenylate-binding protein 2 isoform X1 n=1 Tax=Anas acuta TaxID=28680 RepID=UPI0035C904B3
MCESGAPAGKTHVAARHGVRASSMFAGRVSPLFLDTSGIWWQDPPSLAAEEASWGMAGMAAPHKAVDEDSDLSHLEGDSAEELGVQDPELEAIKARVREMEKEDERLKALQLEAESRLIMSSEAGLFPKTTEEKMEVDQRSIYVGNVDYGGTAEELESHFNSCGQINRVTILCDKFSGHPKGYAYIEFEEKSSVKAAVELDESLFRGRVIKVLPKRTNMPGISSTDRGGYRGRFQARGGLGQRGGFYGGQQARLRGRMYRCVNAVHPAAGGVLSCLAPEEPCSGCLQILQHTKLSSLVLPYWLFLQQPGLVFSYP